MSNTTTKIPSRTHSKVTDIHVLGPSAAYKSLPLLGSGKKDYDPTKRFWLPLIFSDDVFFHAMLTAAASHRSRLLASSPSSKDTSMLALAHKVEACRLMNERIQEKERYLSDAAISAVLYLIAAEV